jgi:serine/threonine protein kinase
MDTPQVFNRAFEAVVYPDGHVRLLTDLQLSEVRRALVMILNEPPAEVPTRSDAPHARSSPVPSREERDGWPEHYRVIRQIAAGGMGTTFQARDERNGRIVCLKRLHPGVSKTSLLQECRSLARLDSPGIVRLIDFDVQPDTPYLVTEYIEGPTLAQYVRSHQPLPDSFVQSAATALLEAIAYAHEREVLHCDLKPGNILLYANADDPTLPPASLKIVDFGLAVVDREDDQGAITAEGRFAGTPAYMAPEQMQRRRLSGACDVYAIGIILWELLTGERAFPGDDVYSILSAKIDQQAGLTLNGHSRPVPKSLATVVDRCTHPDFQRRPTAREALALLAKVDKPWWRIW